MFCVSNAICNLLIWVRVLPYDPILLSNNSILWSNDFNSFCICFITSHHINILNVYLCPSHLLVRLYLFKSNLAPHYYFLPFFYTEQLFIHYIKTLIQPLSTLTQLMVPGRLNQLNEFIISILAELLLWHTKICYVTKLLQNS